MSAPRILIVEDEPLIRLFVVDSLEEFGFQVAEADNASQAMAMFADGGDPIDGVIIDVGLPDKPGDVLADELRAARTELPIIIASGRDATEYEQRYGHDSRMAVLGKPYTTEMLLDALRDLGLAADVPG